MSSNYLLHSHRPVVEDCISTSGRLPRSQGLFPTLPREKGPGNEDALLRCVASDTK